MRISRPFLFSVAALSYFAFAVADNEQQVLRAPREQRLGLLRDNDVGSWPSLSPSVDVVVMTNTLSEYYENIVDQVMATLTEDIMASAPYSFMSIFHLRPAQQDVYQPALRSFVHALKDHLNLLRVNLLASVRPLVESNMAGVLPAPGDTISRGGTISSAELTKAILCLNQRMGSQLGLIVNAREAADTIIDQSLPDTPSISNNDNDNGDDDDERKQQQQQHLDTPFVFLQRQIIQRRKNRNLARLESLLCTEQHDLVHQPIDSKAANAMTNWLSSWLSDIEQILSVEFNERVQDATQSILEDFLVDE